MYLYVVYSFFQQKSNVFYIFILKLKDEAGFLMPNCISMIGQPVRQINLGISHRRRVESQCRGIINRGFSSLLPVPTALVALYCPFYVYQRVLIHESHRANILERPSSISIN